MRFFTDFIPMKAPSHLASSSRRYFGTRSLNRENSEEIANYRSLFCISSAYFHLSDLVRRRFHRYKEKSAVVEKTSENFSNFKLGEEKNYLGARH